MKEDKRKLLLKAFNNEEVDRIPIGFWHHFILGEDQFKGLENPDLLEKALNGHKNFFEIVNPDMMKLMNEGFFGYPPIMENKLETEEDLLKIKSIGKNHPWIIQQVEYVKKLVNLFKNDVMTFYNVFAPLQVIRIRLEFLDMDFKKFVKLAETYPDSFKKAGMEIQKDIYTLVEKLLKETDLDGIYYCVQNIQTEKFDKKRYKELIEPTEIEVLRLANELRENNILHICGYDHHTNNLDFYKDYEAKVYNWATFTENVFLQEGKRFFGGKCVLGGFDNNPNTLIDKGTEEEIYSFIKKLISENGYKGFVLGADCSIPNDIDDKRIKLISDIVHKLRRNKNE